MITLQKYVSNAAEIWQQIENKNLSKTNLDILEEGHNFVIEYHDLYNQDEEIKSGMEQYIDLVNKVLKKEDSAPEKTAKPNPEAKAKPAKRQTTPKKTTKPKATAEPKQPKDTKKVYEIPIEVKFIKRFTNLFNRKEVYFLHLLRLLKPLQAAIISRQINKKSEYAKEIEAIQQCIVEFSKSAKSKDFAPGIAITSEYVAQVKSDIIDKYKFNTIVNKYTAHASTAILKAFNRYYLKPDKTAAEKERLMLRINKELPKLKNDPRYKEVVKARDLLKSNEQYNATYQLRGLGAVSINQTPSTPQPLTEFVKQSFETMPLTGIYGRLIGSPQIPMRIMVYGAPGGGKSSFSILFSNYLATNHNQRVLIVSKEEGFSYTIKEKVERLNAVNRNIDLSDRIPEDISKYNVVVLDSINTMQLTPQQLRDLYYKNPKTSFVSVFQTTKDGNFKGAQEFEHDADTVIRIEKFTATPQKNRFGGKETIKFM